MNMCGNSLGRRDSRVAKPEEAGVNLRIVDALPTTEDVLQRLDAARVEEGAKQEKQAARATAEKKALVERLSAPSEVSDEEGIRRALVTIERAVKNCPTEVQLYRFPHELCTNNGRAINQQELGWDISALSLNASPAGPEIEGNDAVQ